jgi:hypothetical protein
MGKNRKKVLWILNIFMLLYMILCKSILYDYIYCSYNKFNSLQLLIMIIFYIIKEIPEYIYGNF